MFRLASVNDITLRELEDWYKNQRGKKRVGKGGQVWGFIMYQPHIRLMTYVSPRNPAIHYFYKYEGYGVSESIFPKLEENGVDYVFLRCIPYLDAGLTWFVAEFAQYENGIYYCNPKNTSDSQRIVPCAEMIKVC